MPGVVLWQCPFHNISEESRKMNQASAKVQGQLLLDAGTSGAGFFRRTVIFVCRHDEEGAFGLVLNRNTGKKLGEVFPEGLSSRLKKLPLFLGGPVQTTVLSFLMGGVTALLSNTCTGIRLGHSLEELEEQLESGWADPEQLKVFAGYAGWAPGQLESEMERGAWVIAPLKKNLLFESTGDAMWSTILRSLGGVDHTLLSLAPDDPSLN